MLAFEATFNDPADIVKTPYWRIWMPDTPEQRKLNCSYRRRIKPPCQPFIIRDAAHLSRTIRPYGRPSTAKDSLKSTVSASASIRERDGPTTRF